MCSSDLDTDGRPQGWAAAERNVGSVGNALKALDYKTGQVKWSHPLAMGPSGSTGGPMGLLSTAGGLLFGNDGAGSLVAFGLEGKKPPVPRWHAHIGSIENAPETYIVDGRQYVLVTAEGAIYAFYLQ